MSLIVGADGTDEPRNITNHPASDGNPTWSPDGNEIAFATDRDDNFEIYAMRIDGTDSPRNLTRNPAKDVFPDWSPDPTNPQIVFRSTRNGLNQLFLFDLETNALRRLTSSNANDDQPSWSPDASTIAFASNRYPDDRAISENGKQQHYDIYLLEPASRNLLRLTSNPVDEMYPDWNPEP
ncbi:MAG: hypothetical protein HC837_10035 [Chloroflexaceae bacterium]|nr:hypothetical protein [Chloroflexaceae bacterium]